MEAIYVDQDDLRYQMDMNIADRCVTCGILIPGYRMKYIQGQYICDDCTRDFEEAYEWDPKDLI